MTTTWADYAQTWSAYSTYTYALEHIREKSYKNFVEPADGFEIDASDAKFSNSDGARAQDIKINRDVYQ